VQCRYGRVYAQTNGLMDGTTRLHAGEERVHHLMGVSCFAERVVVSQTSVVRVPPGVAPEVAAVSACAVITGVGAAMNAVHGGAGRPLAVFGTGGVGLCAVMGASMIGADPIIAVDVDETKLGLAVRFGANQIVNARTDDVVARIREMTDGGAHWTIDAVGSPVTMQQAVSALRPTGTMIAVGLNNVDATFAVPVNELVQQQKRIIGALYGASNPRVDLPRIFALHLAGRLPLGDLITGRRPLDEVNEAYADLRSGTPGRTVLIP
jgi:S-(hydroxymethyl)glutathione dehydrogenase / alcohol dehydrogenase